MIHKQLKVFSTVNSTFNTEHFVFFILWKIFLLNCWIVKKRLLYIYPILSPPSLNPPPTHPQVNPHPSTSPSPISLLNGFLPWHWVQDWLSNDKKSEKGNIFQQKDFWKKVVEIINLFFCCHYLYLTCCFLYYPRDQKHLFNLYYIFFYLFSCLSVNLYLFIKLSIK